MAICFNSSSALFAGGTENSMPTAGTGAPAQALALTALTGAGTLIRGCFYEFNFGISAVPGGTDASVQWFARRCTTAPTTGTAVVSQTADPAETARSTTVGLQPVQNATVAGTVAATGSLVFGIPANQRASYRWVVDPGSSGRILTPATTANGIVIGGFQASGAYTGTYAVSAYYLE